MEVRRAKIPNNYTYAEKCSIFVQTVNSQQLFGRQKFGQTIIWVTVSSVSLCSGRNTVVPVELLNFDWRAVFVPSRALCCCNFGVIKSRRS